MKVIIAGSRGITDINIVAEAIATSGLRSQITEIVSGRCRYGVDRLGEVWAANQTPEIPVHGFPALWSVHGRAAGHLRNHVMAEYADAAVVVWDGASPGSKSMISAMAGLRKPCYVRIVRAPSMLSAVVREIS